MPIYAVAVASLDDPDNVTSEWGGIFARSPQGALRAVERHDDQSPPGEYELRVYREDGEDTDPNRCIAKALLTVGRGCEKTLAAMPNEQNQQSDFSQAMQRDMAAMPNEQDRADPDTLEEVERRLEAVESELVMLADEPDEGTEMELNDEKLHLLKIKERLDRGGIER